MFGATVSRPLARAATVILFLLALAFPSAAGAYIYWGSFQSNSIGRAYNDGTHREQQFIGGLGAPNGLALAGSNIYWTDFGRGTISRADLDGTHVRTLLGGAQSPDGLTVYGDYIYWANFGLNAVGRARLDGTQVNQQFIAGLSPIGGVAIRPPYIYWSNFQANTIGRANLDGSQPNYAFITGASSPDGLAISGNQIYWSNYHTGTIGRANLDGSSPNQQFIVGGHSPDDLAIHGGFIYWVNTQFNSIGRAELDGTGVNQAFFRTPRSDIQAVAVSDGGPPPPPAKSTIGLMGRMGFVSPGGVIGVQVGCFNGGTTCAGQIKMTHGRSLIGQTSFRIPPEHGGFQNLQLSSEGSRLLSENRRFHLLAVDVIVTGSNGQRIFRVMHLARWVWGNGSGRAHTTSPPLSPLPRRPATSRIGLMGMMGFVSPGLTIGVQVGCFDGRTTCAGQIKMTHNGVLVGQRSFAIAPETGGFQNLDLSSKGNSLLDENKRFRLLAVNVTITGTNGQRISEVMNLARWVWD